MKLESTQLLYRFLLLSLLLAVMGCDSNSDARKAQESDANGYVCVSDKHANGGYKFYTDRQVFAEKCPECGSTNIKRVYAYVPAEEEGDKEVPSDGPTSERPKGTGAEKKGQVVIAPRGSKNLPFHLPNSEELQAWGAVKAEESSVKLE